MNDKTKDISSDCISENVPPSKYSQKKRKQAQEEALLKKELDAQKKIEEDTRYAPRKTPYMADAYVNEIYAKADTNDYLVQGVTRHETANFEREHPLAHGGCGTYAFHEYKGTELIVEIRVPVKSNTFCVNIRDEVLAKNGITKLHNARIERLRDKNINKKLRVEVVDTFTKHDGRLTHPKSVIAMLDLEC